MQVWRIVKFKVTEWPVSDYGKFYNGDSYIILNVSNSVLVSFAFLDADDFLLQSSVSVAAETSMLLKVTDLRIVGICIIIHKWMFVNELVRVELIKTNSYVHPYVVWQMNISVFFHPCKILPQHPSTLSIKDCSLQ